MFSVLFCKLLLLWYTYEKHVIVFVKNVLAFICVEAGCLNLLYSSFYVQLILKENWKF